MARVRRRISTGSTGKSFQGVVAATLGFVGVIMILVLVNAPIHDKRLFESLVFHSPNEIPPQIIARLDAILVLGGGVPHSSEEPPIYVQRRLDDAALVKDLRQQLPKKPHKDLSILCLSAGTAHMPQLMSGSGLPIWESTSSAAYLQAMHDIRDNVYVETTSYDTIGNAFFARTSHTDVVGWKNLLIITNEFHMERSKAIFDWVFGLSNSVYNLVYLASPNTGLDFDALTARQEKERSGLQSVRTLAQKYRSLKDVWLFLNQQHSLYSASGLIERSENAEFEGVSDFVRMSYGAP